MMLPLQSGNSQQYSSPAQYWRGRPRPNAVPARATNGKKEDSRARGGEERGG